MSTPDAVPPRLVSRLEEVQAWREAAELQIRKQIREIDREEERLHASIDELKRQILSLGQLRDEIRGRASGLDAQAAARGGDALLTGLSGERALIESRATLLQQAQANERGQAEAMLEDPELAQLVAEYESYSDLRNAMATLPPSYQYAIEAHHKLIRARLTPLFEKVEAMDVSMELPMMRFSVVLSLERAEDGHPELLQILAPVSADIYTDWVDRPEDLSTCVAYRAVEFASRLAAALGVPDAPITYPDFEGYLAIRIGLGGIEDAAAADDLTERAAALLQEIADHDSAIGAVKLAPWPIWLAPEILDPPEPPADLWPDNVDETDAESWHGDPPEAWDDAGDVSSATISGVDVELELDPNSEALAEAPAEPADPNAPEPDPATGSGLRDPSDLPDPTIPPDPISVDEDAVDAPSIDEESP